MGKNGTNGNASKSGGVSPSARQSATGGNTNGGSARPGAGAGKGAGQCWRLAEHYRRGVWRQP
jgi:hypothetical protein